jgi:FtsH-binding integral membrane protein
MLNLKRNLLKNKQMIKTFARNFSSGGQGPNLNNMAQSANYALLGIGAAGFTYMLWSSRKASQPYPTQTQEQMYSAPAQGLNQQRSEQRLAASQPKVEQGMINPVVQSRVQSALAYFGGGIALTGASVALFRNTAIAHTNPLLLLIPTIGALIGTQYLNYHTQGPLKHATWGAFCGLEGLALAPLINMAGMPIVFNAMAATGTMMGLLAGYAYTSPTSDFMSWRGGLTMGLCGLIGVSVVNMFWPSPILATLSLYGGL